jgi:hypothetical protein
LRATPPCGAHRCRNIVLLYVHGKDLAPPSLCQFLLDLLDQLPFLGMNAILGEMAEFRNNESILRLSSGPIEENIMHS